MGGRGGYSSVAHLDDVKAGDIVYVQHWFSFDLPNYAIPPSMVKVIGESASGKAWKVDIETETNDGERDLFYEKWMPKSAVKTLKRREYELKQMHKRYKQGQKKYEKLLEYAKSTGVKGIRKGLKHGTIISRLQQAGYDYKW